MDASTQSGTVTMPADLKRKRESEHSAAPPPKAPKTHNHLQINYLARQYQEDLPLLSNDDSLPHILSILAEYQGVLDRHESMACNLGARPLGPILVKRFERLFDGPPKVLQMNGKGQPSVTWLDVVEFARNKPEQFVLGQQSEGVRVCQIYTKQCRVQISEEDFVLISSGIPQKMIPPQPIEEDEEKELGTIEILEKTLGQVCQLADQVAARARQLNHRLKGRKQAILDRRATGAPAAVRAVSPSNVALMNGAAHTASATLASLAQSGGPGFVAVNTRQPDTNGLQSHGHNKNGVSPAVRDELLSKFSTTSRRQSGDSEMRRTSSGTAHSVPTASSPVKQGKPLPPAPTPYGESEYGARPMHHSGSPVPIPGTPASLLPPNSARASVSHSGPPPERDDGGPYKAEMVARMEGLAKGERVLPPCDRCRRLHMDCLKNLTACMGCTKKHAKCSWKEVREEELKEYQGVRSSVVADNASRGTSEGDVEMADADGQRRENGNTAASAASPERGTYRQSVEQLPSMTNGVRQVPSEAYNAPEAHMSHERSGGSQHPQHRQEHHTPHYPPPGHYRRPSPERNPHPHPRDAHRSPQGTHHQAQPQQPPEHPPSYPHQPTVRDQLHEASINIKYESAHPSDAHERDHRSPRQRSAQSPPQPGPPHHYQPQPQPQQQQQQQQQQSSPSSSSQRTEGPPQTASSSSSSLSSAPSTQQQQQQAQQ